MKYIEELAVSVIRGVSMIILTILLCYSMFNTTFLKDTEEYSYFLADSPLKHLAVIAAVLAGMAVLYHIFKKQNFEGKESWAKILFIAVLVFGTGWVLISQAKPISDSSAVFAVAAQLHEGDYSAFWQGGYLYHCPNQKGLVLFLYFLQTIVGKNNYLCFQILNVAALALCQWYLYKIVLFFSKNRNLALLVYLAEVCFFPSILYTSFTYGTILGLTFVTAALWLVCCYLEQEKLRCLAAAAVCMALSTVFKSNYLICVVAIVLISMVSFCKKPKLKSLLVPCFFLLSYFAVSFSVEETLGYLTEDFSRENCFSAAAYVEMGLQESYMAPGWFNAYVYDVCRENNYEKEVYDAVIKEDLKERISYFAEHPKEAYSFFARKTISQWCEPTFQSMWIILVRESLLEETSLLRYWLVAPYSGMNILLRGVLNYVQTLVYFGALVYVLREKKAGIYSWSGLVIMLGGFLFHTFWEAKPQYTFSYFLLLIPYGVAGLCMLAKQLAAVCKKGQLAVCMQDNRMNKKKCVHLCLTAAVILLLILGLWICGVAFENPQDSLHYQSFLIHG